MSSDQLDWEDQRAFLAVITTRSLSGAARALGLTQPTVRRRVEALERAIGQPLFSRGVNGLVPTDQARDLAEHVRRMEHASHAFRRAAVGVPGSVGGTVRLSVSEFVGIAVLPTMLATLREKHPALAVELVLSNESADLLHQEVDVAVRMHRPQQDALVARHVGRIAIGLFASPDYVRANGAPASLAELATHPLIGPDRAVADLALIDVLTVPGAPRPRFVLRTDSHPAQFAAIRAGLGIGVAQVPVAGRDLVRILPDVTVHQFDTWVVAHEDLRHSARIGAVFDHLCDSFTAYCA